LAAVFTAALLVGVASSPAVASDHLANAIDASGRNPVPQNADPGTVPGEGNPFFGHDTGTPAADLNEVGIRVDDRSEHHGDPQVV